MSNIHAILIHELNKNIQTYNYYKCFDIDYIIKDTLDVIKPLILQQIRQMINQPINYYFKHSIDYAIQIDIIQLQSDGCLFSDFDINDIYTEHLYDITKYLYNYLDVINY